MSISVPPQVWYHFNPPVELNFKSAKSVLPIPKLLVLAKIKISFTELINKDLPSSELGPPHVVFHNWFPLLSSLIRNKSTFPDKYII